MNAAGAVQDRREARERTVGAKGPIVKCRSADTCQLHLAPTAPLAPSKVGGPPVFAPSGPLVQILRALPALKACCSWKGCARPAADVAPPA